VTGGEELADEDRTDVAGGAGDEDAAGQGAKPSVEAGTGVNKASIYSSRTRSFAAQRSR
jgi:hypothetical protein